MSTPVRPSSLPAGALVLACLAVACVAPPASESPVPAVTASPGSAEYALQQGQARDWTVRLVTLRRDTLIGHVTIPAAGRVRIGPNQLSLDEIGSVERRASAGGGRMETEAAAGVLLGGLAGIVLLIGHAGASDSPCDHCEMRGFIAGGLAGLVAWIALIRDGGGGSWVSLWQAAPAPPPAPGAP